MLNASILLPKDQSTGTALNYPPRAPSLFPILLIVALSLAVYGNTLDNGFVYDDVGQVLRNEWIKDIKHIPEIFSSNVWKFEGMQSNYYRPLMHVVYMLNYFLFGLRPWGFHLVNIMTHAGVSILVFLIAARLPEESRSASPSPSWAPPFIAAMLFAAHPIHTEAVAWVAGLPELAFSLFSLLSLYLYILSKGKKSATVLPVLSVLSYVFAVLFKETALIFPLILLAYDAIFREPGQPLRVLNYVPYLAVIGLYLMVRVSVLGNFVPIQRYGGLSTYQYAINILPLFTDYLGKLILPVNLNAYHVFHPLTSILEVKGILSLVISSVFVVFAWIMMKKDKTAFFGLTLIVLPLLPVLYVSGVGENTFAERYLYLPSFGFSLLLVSGVIRLAKQRWSPLLVIGLTAALGLYCLGTVQRNTIWKSDLSLWTDTAKKSPDSFVPQEALGDALLNEGWTDEAIECLQAVLRKKPDFLEAHYNIGVAYGKKGLNDEAIRHFQAAIALRPDLVKAHSNLALAYQKKGLMDKVIEQYQTVVSLKPDSLDAHNNLAIAYGEAGKIDQAIEQFLDALRLKPDDINVHYNLGTAYEDKGMIDQALDQFQAALKLNPYDPDIRYKIAHINEIRAMKEKVASRKGKPAGP